MKKELTFIAGSLVIWVVLAAVIKPPMLNLVSIPSIFEEEVDTIPKAEEIVAVRDLNVDIGLITSWEGNTADAVVPSRMSGPTVSMGLDLGTAGPRLIDMVARKCVDSFTLDIMKSANGLRGPAAVAWQKKNTLALTYDERQCIAHNLCYTMLKLIDSVDMLSSAPLEMKTAAVAFSMATGRPQLIRQFALKKQWSSMASFIATFHDDWKGPERAYFVKRRRLEADLVSLKINNRKVEIDPN